MTDRREGERPALAEVASAGGERAARVRVVEFRGTQRTEREDELAAEEPLEVRVVGPSDSSPPLRLSVTMRTPGEDFELAAGFLVSEGLVRSRTDVRTISYCTDPGEPQRHNIVQVRLAPDVRIDPDLFRRNFYTTSSCGICGKAAIENVRTVVPSRPAVDFRVPAEVLARLPAAISARQPLFGRTGGLHGAALFGPDGELRLVREDVGRHNAVDKVVGHELLEGRLGSGPALLLVTGRAGFELVQKAAVAGIPFLAAIGAPSSLAVELARQQRMTLVGFLREGRFNVYAGAERIASEATAPALR